MTNKPLKEIEYEDRTYSFDELPKVLNPILERVNFLSRDYNERMGDGKAYINGKPAPLVLGNPYGAGTAHVPQPQETMMGKAIWDFRSPSMPHALYDPRAIPQPQEANLCIVCGELVDGDFRICRSHVEEKIAQTEEHDRKHCQIMYEANGAHFDDLVDGPNCRCIATAMPDFNTAVPGPGMMKKLNEPRFTGWQMLVMFAYWSVALFRPEESHHWVWIAMPYVFVVLYFIASLCNPLTHDDSK